MTARTPAEMVALTLMAAASVSLFLRRLLAVARIVLAAKPDADFRLRPLAPRFRQFALEVALQARVIRERPLAGLAHAVVFWGFCIFALVTLDHLAQGFGFSFLSPHSGLGLWYHRIASVFAVAVAAAILGLALRRFLLRPKWLGKLSAESGVIAALIFLLMVTHLSRSWWLHTLALLVFLPLIPQTKHLHLLLSPLTVFLRRGSFSRIPPLQGDEDLGLETGRDVTRLVALQAFTCVECGRCMEHCPAYNTGKELNPKEIALGLRSYLRECGPHSGDPLLGKHLSPEAAFQCTTCGACEYQCPVGVEHLPIIIGLRRGAVNTGRWEDEHGGKLFVNLERYGNPFGLPAAERDKVAQKNRLPLFDGSQEYCLWLGCMGVFDPRGREITEALIALLRRLNVSFGVLRKEKCTGDAARRLGNDLLFGQLAEFNIEQIRAAKVKKLLSICPHCVRTIGEDWKEFGFTVHIEHHSEFLARRLESLPDATKDGRLTFHDPCYLGRYRGVYRQPREVVRRRGVLVEAPRHGPRSFCCGAGGGLMFLGEEKGERVSAVRAKELAATGAQAIVTACPFCQSMFRDALAASGPAPRLLDIAEIAGGLTLGQNFK